MLQYVLLVAVSQRVRESDHAGGVKAGRSTSLYDTLRCSATHASAAVCSLVRYTSEIGTVKWGRNGQEGCPGSCLYISCILHSTALHACAGTLPQRTTHRARASLAPAPPRLGRGYTVQECLSPPSRRQSRCSAAAWTLVMARPSAPSKPRRGMIAWAHQAGKGSAGGELPPPQALQRTDQGREPRTSVGMTGKWRRSEAPHPKPPWRSSDRYFVDTTASRYAVGELWHSIGAPARTAIFC